MNFRKVIRVLKTPVTLLLLLAILGFGAYWGYEQVTIPVAKTNAAACVMQDVGPELNPNEVTVRVFNGGDQPRLAKSTRSYLLAWEFHATTYNNTDEAITKPIVLGSSADDPEVKLVQQFLPGSEARGDGRADHVVDVLVGSDGVARTNDPKTSIAVDGPVCLPEIKKASASASPSPSQ